MSDLPALASHKPQNDPGESRTSPSQYATSDRLKDRIALHKLFGEESEDFHSWLFRQVQAPPTAMVLELGCGTGAMWQANRGKVPPGWQLTLTDLSEAMVRETQHNLRDLAPRVTYNRHGAQRLPYGDDSFDLVFANHMLYHVAEPDVALAEIRRVLKPGGRFYAATNGGEHMAGAEALRQLLLAAIPQAKRDSLDISAFSMETGADRLRQHFDEVRLFERRDQLLVTDPEPLIRYVLSLVDPATLARATAAALARWRQTVSDSFEGGVYSLKRVTGFFEAL